MAFLFLPINLSPASFCSAVWDDGSELGPSPAPGAAGAHAAAQPVLLPALLSQELLEWALVPEGENRRIKTQLCCPVWDEELGGARPRTPTQRVPTRGQSQHQRGCPPCRQTHRNSRDLVKKNQLLALIIAYVFVSRARKISTFHQNALG